LTVARLCLGLHGSNRSAQTISPPLRAFLTHKFCARLGPPRCCGRWAVRPARPPSAGSQQGRDGRDLGTPKGEITMANIGTFTAQNDGFTGTVRTLTLNVKVKFVPNDRSSESAPDYRIQTAGGYDIG